MNISTLSPHGLADLVRATSIPALFRRKEEREPVTAKIRPFIVKDGSLTLGLYDLPPNARNSHIYSEVHLPMDDQLVRELREKFAEFREGAFKGEFILSEAGLLDFLEEDLAGLEGDIMVGDSAYSTKFNVDSCPVPFGFLPYLYLVEINRKI